jgi:dihydrofolate reductase
MVTSPAPTARPIGSSWIRQSILAPIREQASKDIWLFGGGILFRSFLDAGLVDTVEVAIVPVLLGDGVPLLPHPACQAELTLKSHRVYGSGIVSLEYAIGGASG